MTAAVDPVRLAERRLASARARIVRGDRLDTTYGPGAATSKPKRHRSVTTVRVRLDSGRSLDLFDHEVWPIGWDR